MYLQTEQPLNPENDRYLPPRRPSWPVTTSARRFYTAKTHSRHRLGAYGPLSRFRCVVNFDQTPLFGSNHDEAQTYPLSKPRFGRNKHMRIPLLAILTFLSLAIPASARTQFPFYGAKGSAGAVDECLPGSYFIGLVGLVGGWTDQITVVCGQLQPDGSISGSKSLPSRGGTGGGFKSVLCGKDEAITWLSPSRTPNYEISWTDFVCTNIKTGTWHKLVFGGAHPVPGVGVGGIFECPSGELGTGMEIRYGKYVNGLGLICNAYTAPVRTPVVTTPKPTPTPTPAPTPAPAPTPTFVKVTKDGDVYTPPCGGDLTKKTGVILRAGTSNVKLVLNKNPWFQLQWPSGSGCLYSGPGYVSLQLP